MYNARTPDASCRTEKALSILLEDRDIQLTVLFEVWQLRQDCVVRFRRLWCIMSEEFMHRGEALLLPMVALGRRLSRRDTFLGLLLLSGLDGRHGGRSGIDALLDTHAAGI